MSLNGLKNAVSLLRQELTASAKGVAKKSEDYLALVKTLVSYSEVWSEEQKSGLCKALDALYEKTDFFNAPASARFHGAYPYGLVLHSLGAVYFGLMQVLVFGAGTYEDVFLGLLLHDLCKVDSYVPAKKSIKKEGKWVEVDGYDYRQGVISIGHGAESVRRLYKWGFAPYVSELCEQAIAFHMGFSDMSEMTSYAYNPARDANSMVLLFESSDAYSASWLKDGKKVLPTWEVSA